MKLLMKFLVIVITIVQYIIINNTQWYNQCFFNWLSLNHNETTIGYKYSNVSYWLSYTCNTLLQWYENFVCNNWVMQWQNWWIPSLYTNNTCINSQPKSCILWWVFWQQIEIPHFNWLWVPNTSDLWTFLFTGYKKNFVENISMCSLTNINSLSTGENTYVYCKNWILKDLILYNIYNSEQNFSVNTYPYTQCSQLKNSDCQINNTIIKDGESITFFENNNSVWWVCNSQIRTCNNWILSWNFYFSNCLNYNWSCWESNWKYLSKAPVLNLCAAWIYNLTPPIFNTTTNQRSWTCNGLQWNNETCVAYKKTDEQSIWKCKIYNEWVVTLNWESQFLCEVWNSINFSETSLWWKRNCQSEYWTSWQCSTKKSITATWKVIYSYNWDWSVTASLVNISPIWAYVSNNNNSNSKRFTENWSFIFQLKFNDSITNITAKVENINNRQIKINDLILDYKGNICNKQKNITIKASNKYNLLDVQTMINHCILIPKIAKWEYSINMKKTLTRWEFIKSIYNFTKTIRPYSNWYSNSNNTKYKWVPNTEIDQNAIKRLINIKWDIYIQHSKINNTSTYKRNNNVTSKEIYELIKYILNSHDDNDIYFKNIWEKEKINTYIKRDQYSNILRRLLEQYDRVALWNNIKSLENIEKRISWLSNVNQKLELENIYNNLHTQDPTKFEKLWLSKWVLLNDISRIINNGQNNKKSIISISMQDIINKTTSSNIISNNTTKQQKTRELFKKMNY